MVVFPTICICFHRPRRASIERIESPPLYRQLATHYRARSRLLAQQAGRQAAVAAQPDAAARHQPVGRAAAVPHAGSDGWAGRATARAASCGGRAACAWRRWTSPLAGLRPTRRSTWASTARCRTSWLAGVRAKVQLNLSIARAAHPSSIPAEELRARDDAPLRRAARHAPACHRCRATRTPLRESPQRRGLARRHGDRARATCSSPTAASRRSTSRCARWRSPVTPSRWSRPPSTACCRCSRASACALEIPTSPQTGLSIEALELARSDLRRHPGPGGGAAPAEPAGQRDARCAQGTPGAAVRGAGHRADRGRHTYTELLDAEARPARSSPGTARATCCTAHRCTRSWRPACGWAGSPPAAGRRARGDAQVHADAQQRDPLAARCRASSWAPAPTTATCGACARPCVGSASARPTPSPPTFPRDTA